MIVQCDANGNAYEQYGCIDLLQVFIVAIAFCIGVEIITGVAPFAAVVI